VVDKGMFENDVTRREAMKTAIKAGAYAAPIVLAASVPAGVLAANSGAPTATTTPTTAPAVGIRLSNTSVTQTPTLRTCQGQSAPGTGDHFQFVENVNVPVTNGGPSTAFDVFVVAPSFVAPPAGAGAPTTVVFPGIGTAYKVNAAPFVVGPNGSGTFNGTVTVTTDDNPPVFPNPITVFLTFAGTNTVASPVQQVNSVTNIPCASGPLSTP